MSLSVSMLIALVKIRKFCHNFITPQSCLNFPMCQNVCLRYSITAKTVCRYAVPSMFSDKIHFTQVNFGIIFNP